MSGKRPDPLITTSGFRAAPSVTPLKRDIWSWVVEFSLLYTIFVKLPIFYPLWYKWGVVMHGGSHGADMDLGNRKSMGKKTTPTHFI